MKRNHIYLIMLLCMIASNSLFMRCTPADHFYSEYLENGERIYPGRPDSIEFRTGNNRAAIRAKISPDSRVVKMRVSWGRDNEIEIPILREEIAEYKQVIIPNVPEGSYTFEIRTYDQEGNQSMRSEIFGRVYGQTYIANLNNRIINNLEVLANNQVRLNWFVESRDTTQLGANITYPTLSGDSTKIFVPSEINQILLPDIDLSGTLTYQTLYKPSSLAIDTFYTQSVTVRSRELLPPDREEYAQSNWSINSFSSQEPNNNRAAVNLLDGRDDTFWIARFSSPATNYPNHWVVIDMGATLEVSGFMFAQKNGDRKIKEMEVYVSNDNKTWELAALANLRNVDRTKQYFDIAETRSFRYFKIVPINGHDSQQQPGLAMVGVYKNVFGD
ncbi:DUF4998 domain-containing protein [Sphingobacterium corticis]|uniref:DUF4998 domain-containing protein n=1 Tax=Sphingobacterium corticis TaxID=1812823 RepID=A0ABW5NMJ0_9SPHI